MSYTIVAFLWRKPGITPLEFKTHYETQHIPLLLELLGSRFPASHSRFYLPRLPSDPSSTDVSNLNLRPKLFLGDGDGFSWDAYCELCFENHIAFEDFRAAMLEPENATKIAADEEQFLDRSKINVVEVDPPEVTRRPTP
ncbi:hypothetical protein DTO271D3_3685 [Paecilomyces variotii]|nr:hypothetical protein DTO207G8_5558 [Paecilomyces variotii]KAJ9316109.1 hypothetical protein DTO271D3_3685 [Paecilomyces variotii]